MLNHIQVDSKASGTALKYMIKNAVSMKFNTESHSAFVDLDLINKCIPLVKNGVDKKNTHR